MQIEDGKGRGFQASVSESQRLNVSSKTAERIFYISRDNGLAFIAVSTVASAAAGSYAVYLKNTSTTKNLFIERVEYHSANAALWKLWQVTGTAAGTALTASNLNLTSGTPAEASVYGSAAVTGLTTVKQLGSHRNTAGGEGEMSYHYALILGPGDAIAAEYDTGTTGTAEIDIFFHYEDVTRLN